MDIFLQQIANGLLMGIIYSLVAIGLTVIYGIFHIINMVQGTFFMLGAFIAYFLVLNLGIDYFVSLAIASFVTAIIGILCERIAIRPLSTTAQR